MSQVTQQIRKCCFITAIVEIMDLFLDRPRQHHTAVTIALSLEKNKKTTKSHLHALYQNGYLSRVNEKTGIYYLTIENIKLWGRDYVTYETKVQSKTTCYLCNTIYKSERKLRLHRQKYHNGLCSKCHSNDILTMIIDNQTVCQKCFEENEK